MGIFRNCFILDLNCLVYEFEKRVNVFFAHHPFRVSCLSRRYMIAPTTPLTLAIRLFALNGFIALSVAAVMTPFLREITLFFKGSFITIHHYFAAAGLILITLHPIAVVIQTLSLSVLLPHFDSLYIFLLYGGSVA